MTCRKPFDPSRTDEKSQLASLADVTSLDIILTGAGFDGSMTNVRYYYIPKIVVTHEI